MKSSSTEESTTAHFQTTIPGNETHTSSNPDIPEYWFWIAEVVTIVVLVLILWALTSMIIYGTKTRRWRVRPSTSSLSNGSIFVICTVAITVCTSLPITTILLFQYVDEHALSVSCEEMADINVVSYVLSTYTIYMFLWRHQRFIFKHSYVRPSVNPCVNWLSRFFCILITMSALGLILFYVLPTSFQHGKGGCALTSDSENAFIEPQYRNALVIPVAVINFFVIILFLYPAARVKFERQVETDDENFARRESIRPRYPTLSYVQKWANSVAGNSHNTNTSPIELAVRRGVTSCIIIVLLDLISVVVVQLSFPVGWPLVLTMTIYCVALLLKIIAMIFTFGFGSNVLKVFIPHCPRSGNRKRSST